MEICSNVLKKRDSDPHLENAHSTVHDSLSATDTNHQAAVRIMTQVRCRWHEEEQHDEGLASEGDVKGELWYKNK